MKGSKNPPGSRDGFALVVTLTLMVLLSILALGMLSLSTVSLRTLSNSDPRDIARANARLALHLALGQLQMTTGSDRRITAPASLVNKDSPSGFTGAWEAWTQAEQGVTYGKNAKFKGWLVSAPASATPDPGISPGVAPGTSGAVNLLGQGTLKTRPTTPGKDARMALVPLQVKGGKYDGHIAWATIDESVKSRIDLSRESTLPSPVREIAAVASPAANGLKSLPGLSGATPTDERLSRLATTATIDLETSKDTGGPISPDITVWSSTLLTDPVSGGLKKDLSTLFRNGLSATQKTTRLYADSGLQTGSSDPMLGLLATYHDLYKKLDASGGLRASVPAGFAPFTGSASNPVPNPSSYAEPVLTPSVLRVDILFSLITRPVHSGRASGLIAKGRPYLLHMMYLPVVTLHNPYNVPLSFDKYKLSFKDIPIGFRVHVDGQPLTNSLMEFSRLYVSTENAGSPTKQFGITLQSGSTMTLLPGQTKLFGTPRVSPDWTWNDEQPGAGNDGNNLFDWRNTFTNNFNMRPKLVTDTTTSIGFDLDWLTPRPYQTEVGRAFGFGEGIVSLKGLESLAMEYGPLIPGSASAAGNAFNITSEITVGGNVYPCGAIRVAYGDKDNLKKILEEGTSVRFPRARSFPEMFPGPGDPPISTVDIFELNSTALKNYVRPKPFVLFSISSKTSKESFFPTRPFADGSTTPRVANIDLAAGKDAPADAPLEMVMMPVSNGIAPFEDFRAEEEGYHFGGHGAQNGSRRATFTEIPQIPLQSVAQFRHAGLGGTGFQYQAALTVGESLANPFIPADKTKDKRISDGADILDHTWLANTALWDSHFLSTIVDQAGPGARSAAVQANDFFTGTGRLLNSRLRPLKSPDATAAGKLTGSDGWLIAASMMRQDGGFNVNSTSEEAWTSVLSALREKSLDTPAGKVASSATPFPRVRRPSAGAVPGAVGVDHEVLWQGFRELSETEIRALAKEIVVEIRARGPFLSVSEFVNRRIGNAGDERSKNGAIQAAISRTITDSALQPFTIPMDGGNSAAHKYQFAAAAYGPNTIHAPGALSQGDVMGTIGPHVTVRGDTFTIRAYGDAMDKKSGNILARAWCEAVVQRTPEYSDPTNPPQTSFASLSATNKQFGRRYEIISFRWLQPDEV